MAILRVGDVDEELIYSQRRIYIPWSLLMCAIIRRFLICPEKRVAHGTDWQMLHYC